MKYVAILTAVALGSAAIIAVAGDQGGHQGRKGERLKAADTNGDGLISREEAKALPRLAESFDAIDANRDGQVTSDELRAHRKAHRGDGWKKLDADADGKISKAEAAKAPRFAGHFDQVDANRDGFVTQEEMKAAHAKGSRGTK